MEGNISFKKSPLFHKHIVTRYWLSEKIYDYITLQLVTPKLLDLNPNDYYVWMFIEKGTTRHPHSNIAVLKTAVVQANRNHAIAACGRFRAGIGVSEALGGFV